MQQRAAVCTSDVSAFPTAAHLVLARARPAVTSLAHVIQSVSVFLDHSHQWTLESASASGHVHLLDRLAAHEWSGLSADFREARFLYNVRGAAREGQVDVLHWWRSQYLPGGLDVASAIRQIAAYYDHLHVVQWLYQVDGQAPSLDRMQAPLRCELPEIVYWMHEHHAHVRLEICLDEAAHRGDLAFIKWVQTQQQHAYAINEQAIESAAIGGHLSVLQYLAGEVPNANMQHTYSNACYIGAVDVIAWLLTHCCMSAVPVHSMFMQDHLHVVKRFVEGYEWPETHLKELWINEAMNMAATHGKMDILRYLSTHNLDLQSNSRLLECGIASKSLDIVKFLLDQHCTSEKDLLALAAATGDFAMVKWVYAHCDIKRVSRSAMDISAKFNLAMVKFLHECNRSEGCTTMALDNAAVCGHLDIVMFLHSHRREGCTVRAISEAAGNGHLEVVKFLHQHRSEGNASQALRSAASNGRLAVVKWLHENATIPARKLDLVYKEAIESGQTEVSVYLATHCGARCSKFRVRKLAARGDFHLLEWLLEHGPDPVVIHVKRDLWAHRVMLSPTYIPEFDDQEN